MAYIQFLLIGAIMVFSFGCTSTQSYRSSNTTPHGGYKLDGTIRGSGNAVQMARTLSDNSVREGDAAAYQQAVRDGRAYPFAGGSSSAANLFYYNGIVPPQPVVVPVIPVQVIRGNRPLASAGDAETSRVARKALEKAQLALDAQQHFHPELAE